MFQRSFELLSKELVNALEEKVCDRTEVCTVGLPNAFSLLPFRFSFFTLSITIHFCSPLSLFLQTRNSYTAGTVGTKNTIWELELFVELLLCPNHCMTSCLGLSNCLQWWNNSVGVVIGWRSSDCCLKCRRMACGNTTESHWLQGRRTVEGFFIYFISNTLNLASFKGTCPKSGQL